MTTKMKPRKFLPYRAKGLAHYPDGKWFMGTFWRHTFICDPLTRTAMWSNFRMHFRKIIWFEYTTISGEEARPLKSPHG